jgi:hypothetical protein
MANSFKKLVNYETKEEQEDRVQGDLFTLGWIK